MNEEPTIFKRPSEIEIAQLIDACRNDPTIQLIARRLAFMAARLESAIEGPKGWKEESVELKARIKQLEDKINEA